MKKDLIRKTSLEYEGTVFNLEYSLTEDTDGNDSVYGVEIRMKKATYGKQVIIEGKQILPVFYSRKTVMELIEMMADNYVFPISLEEVVLEYIMDKICVRDAV